MTSIFKLFSSLYKSFQVLSLDVVLGVLALSLFATKLLDVEAPLIWLLIITMATWAFYTIDHLIDGIKSKGETTIFRHLFHYRYKNILGPLSVIITLSAIILSLLFLNFQIICFGFILGILVLTYFLALSFGTKKKSFFLQKEFIIAFVYAIGIWMAPIIWSGKIPEIFIIIVISILFLLAWAEGIMASYFDFENDLKQSHNSFTILFGKQNTRRFLIVLHILIFIIIKLSVFIISSSTQLIAILIMALMNLSLLVLILNPKYFSAYDRYRSLGELIFWLPILIFFADLF